jgi:hypothetical protein
MNTLQKISSMQQNIYFIDGCPENYWFRKGTNVKAKTF